jgi:hypothetical protein
MGSSSFPDVVSEAVLRAQRTLAEEISLCSCGQRHIPAKESGLHHLTNPNMTGATATRSAVARS